MEFEEVVINSQVKKDEDLMGKSSGDTNLVSGSNNHLKDLQNDNQPDIKYKPLPTCTLENKTIPKSPPEFKPSNYNITENKKYNFWNIYAIVVTILIILGFLGFGYLIKENKFTPSFNFTTEPNYEITLTPSINNPTSNEFKNNFSNNFEINFDLSEDFINKVCGNSS